MTRAAGSTYKVPYWRGWQADAGYLWEVSVLLQGVLSTGLVKQSCVMVSGFLQSEHLLRWLYDLSFLLSFFLSIFLSFSLSFFSSFFPHPPFFPFVNMMNYSVWISNVELALHSQDKPHVLMMYYPFCILLYQLTNISLRISASFIYKDYWSVVFLSLTGFRVWVMLGS